MAKSKVSEFIGNFFFTSTVAVALALAVSLFAGNAAYATTKLKHLPKGTKKPKVIPVGVESTPMSGSAGVGATSVSSVVNPGPFTWKSVPNDILAKNLSVFFEGEGRGETDALLVYRKGELIYERYGHGYDVEKKHRSWSMAKSFTTTYLGIMIQKGLVKATDTVDQFFPEAKGTAWEKVTLLNLATMTDGMKWEEGYEWSPLDSHVTTMLYRIPAMFGMGEYKLKQHHRVAAPGERFLYSSGETNLLAACLKKRLPNEDWISFVRENLFGPLGIEKFTLEMDQTRNIVGSSYLYLTPRDYLRFGVMFLQNGRWEGKEVVPESWVKSAQTPSSAFNTLRLDNDPNDHAYSTGFWLNRPIPTAQLGRAHQSLPDDAYYAKGYQGQYILIIPSEETVMVRMGLDRRAENRFKLDEYRSLYQTAIAQSDLAPSRSASSSVSSNKASGIQPTAQNNNKNNNNKRKRPAQVYPAMEGASR